MPLDLEEQEKVDELRAWWKQNRGWIGTVVTAAAVAFAGWQGWRIWQFRSSSEAAGQYDTLLKASQVGDAKALRDAAGALAENHSRSLYATMGAMTLARFYVERGDPKGAQAQLRWVIERTSSPEFRDLARLRLASVLLDAKSYDDAIRILEGSHGEAFASQFAILRGDILVAAERKADARAAYKLALEKAGKAESALRETVEIRLEALGG